VKKVLILCLLAIVATFYAGAQVANNTSLVGTVTDSTGAAIAGAKVSAINEDTKVAYDAVTNAEGYYSVTGQINPGTYDVVVEQKGFQKEKQTGVIVVINEASRTDFSLKPGSQATEITISANTPAIQTDDPLLGETVSEEMVHDLPTNSSAGRNALDLANIASNVTVSTSSALTGVPPGVTGSGAGTRGVNNDITLDGISIMNNLGSTVYMTPNTDALESVQTTNGNYTAQYGNYLGIHINEATKAGTNSIHGTVYDYLQNDDLNSRGFNRATTIPAKAEQRYNLFGGVADGPVVIPHLYNGRDKTFFTGSYEGIRQHSITNSYSQAFTTAERGGDFSQLLNPGLAAGQSGAAKPVLLYSPIDGHPYYNNALTSQVINDQPTANAAIVNNILAYAAMPNVNNTYLSANNYSSIPASTTENQSLDRIDEVINQNHRLFGRYDWQKVVGVSAAREYVNNNYNPNDDRNLAFGYTWIVRPNLVNDLRGGFNWLKTSSLDYFYEFGPNNADSLLGLPSPYGIGQASGDPGLPDIGGGSSFSESESGDNWIQDDRTYQLYDQVAWTKNRHSILVGVDIRRLMIGRAAVNSARGILSFSAVYTSPINGVSPAAPSGCSAYGGCNSGSTDASLYLGIMSGDTTPLYQVKEQVEQWRDGFFAQDTWTVSNKLTLDYGVRYELPQVPTSANGYARFLDPTYTYLVPPSTATSATTYTPTKGLALTGPNHKDIGPHLGFAYRATDKITVRGGGGIYYNANQMNAYTLMSSNYPFAASVVYTSPTPTTASGTVYDTLALPTPGNGTAPPVAGIAGTYVTAYSVANPLPSETMYQWNLDTGIELWKNAGLEFQYLGSHSIHLNTNFYPNQPQPAGANYYYNPTTNTYNATGGNGYSPVSNSSSATTGINVRRPNQNFGQVRVADNVASAAYDGLTTVFRQRMSHGVTANISYTWAHALDESSDANSSGACMYEGPTGGNDDCKLDWGNASSDVRNKIVGSVTYALPKFQHQNILLQEAAGGWQINGIVTLQSGAPINISFGGTDWAATGVPQSGGAPQRPNWVHPGKVTCNKQSLLAEAYGANTTSCVDITAYAAPARFTYGNMHRNDMYGPGAISNNISVFKNFKIYKQANFQIRAEAYNALNHANAGTPGNITLTPSPVSSTPGSTGYTQGTLAASSSSSAFGYPTAAGAGRIVQLAGKINF